MTEWTSRGRYPDRVTSVRVELRGAHAHLTVWWCGKLSGTLVVGEDEAIALEAVLLGNTLPELPCAHPAIFVHEGTCKACGKTGLWGAR